MEAPKTSATATAALIAAIAGLFCVPFVGPILAVVLGLVGLSSIAKSNGQLAGRGRALAGTIVGVVGVLAHGVVAASLVIGAVAAVNYLDRMTQALNEFRPAIEALERNDLDTAATLLAARSNLTEDEIKARVRDAFEQLGEVDRSELATQDASRSTGTSDVRVSMTWNLYGQKSNMHATLGLHYDGQRWTMQDLRFEPGTVTVDVGREHHDDWDD